MNLNQLYYFRTVAKMQHFTKAASELNISQPTLSYAITTLEQELNTYLFEKKGRNVELTKYGKAFLVHVEKALRELELGVKSLEKLTSSTEGLIDLGYVDPLAPKYIPNMVRRFLDLPNNSRLRFSFFQGTTPNLIKGLKEEAYDLIFCSYAEAEEDIEFIPVFRQDLVLAVPIGHPFAIKNSVVLEDLANSPLITYNKETALGKATLELFEKSNISPNIASEAYNEQAIYGLVSEGLGISIVAHTPDILNYHIKTIPINNELCYRYVYMAYFKNRYLTPAVDRFISFVKSSSIDI